MSFDLRRELPKEEEGKRTLLKQIDPHSLESKPTKSKIISPEDGPLLKKIMAHLATET